MIGLGKIEVKSNFDNDELLKLNAILKSCAMSLVDVANTIDLLLDSIAEISIDVKEVKEKLNKKK